MEMLILTLTIIITYFSYVSRKKRKFLVSGSSVVICLKKKIAVPSTVWSYNTPCGEKPTTTTKNKLGQ